MKYLFVLFFSLFYLTSYSQVQPKEEWWLEEPFRLIQTNLREIDAKDFDIEVYVKSLKDVSANIVLINVGGIVANYYTDLEYHYRNPNLKFDMIEAVVDRLHQEGIRVMGRFDFSKLNEQYAFQNKDWLYVSVAGENVNYNGQVHTCVNGGYQQEYSLKILNEALSRIPLDGVFFNMIGYQVRDYSHNYHGICQADACKNRFKEWSGGLEVPTKQDNNDPVYRRYNQFKAETSNELFYRIHDLIKSYGNQIAISTYTHAGTDFYRRESNSHGALYDDFVPWEYQSAHNVKSAIGSWKDKQVSNAAVHFYGYPARHSADANWLTEQRLFQNVMYGAGVDFYCIGRLDNLEDRQVLENVQRVFKFHKEHEQYLHHTVSGNKVLVLHDGQSNKEYQGIFEILTENHIQFDVMEFWTMNGEDVTRDIESYELVVLPEISRLSDADVKRMDQYVENGGKILATGFTSTKDEIGNPMNKIRLKSFGVKAEYESFEKEQGTYFRIFPKDKETLKTYKLSKLDLVYAWEQGMLCETQQDAKAVLGFIPPAMIGPPEKCYYTEVTDIPGLIFNEYGRGKTAFFPWRLGSIYHHKRHYGHDALIMSSIRDLLHFEEDVKTEASPMVEIARQKDPAGKFEWYGLMNHTGQLGNGFFDPVPIRDITFKIKTEKIPASITGLQNEIKLEFTKLENGWVEITLPELTHYDIILIKY